MSRKKIAILAIVLVAAIGGLAVAQKVAHEGMMHGHMDGQQMAKFLAYKLDLNDQQKQQVQTIIDAEKPKLEPLMKELGDAHHQLESMTQSGNFDEAQARSIVETHKEAFIQMLAEHAKVHQQILAILTPEQQTKFKNMHAGHAGHMHGAMTDEAPPSNK